MAITANVVATTNLHIAGVGRGAVARLRSDERAAHQLDSGERDQRWGQERSNGRGDSGFSPVIQGQFNEE